MQNEEQHQPSTTRTVRIRDFFYHLIVFLFILALIYVVSGTGGAFVWLLLFWGLAVSLHGVYAFLG